MVAPVLVTTMVYWMCVLLFAGTVDGWTLLVIDSVVAGWNVQSRWSLLYWFASVAVATKKSELLMSPALLISPLSIITSMGNANSTKESASPPKLDPSPVGRVRASGIVFTACAFWAFVRSYFSPNSSVSAGSLKMGVKLMSLAVAGSFCQIAMSSGFLLPKESSRFPTPLSDSSYWYWNGLPDADCMSATQAYWAKPPGPVASPLTR